ncbi:FAD-dependent oxidoreductase [Eikenella sp. S3360]|uniref:FAD-dependent oxidoreductase n=1 Tax=Eikenella glucosivorans TaxID=2766967 RepID=A0ABS0NCI1_9NEIS|nr:hydroxysqualene dehydroxylase HpnE [Eikenella glucosivorans]MBH5330003.1 FAD-dependent oxidoreductase [Eikenella glucosivorans]
MSAAPRVAVIGGGWAGLSAAEALCGRAQITLFEAGRQCGGRARAFGGSGGFAHADNGQHILVGAYRQVLDVLARCGVREEEAFLRLPLQWHMADGLQFAARRLPAPLHLLAGVLAARGIGWGEKTALLRQMRALQGLRLEADVPVAGWLRQRQVSHRLQQQFWQPLVWGAMNTDLEQASLQRLQNVLRDGVWAERAASDFLLPKQDLGRLFAGPVCRRLQKHGAAICLETRVPQMAQALSGSLLINGEAFDAAVLAVAPYHVPALLPEAAPPEIAAALAALEYHAITTVYLRYADPPALPVPITGLAEGTAQWFVDRDALGLGRGEVSAVISLSDQLGKLSREEWAARVHQDLLRINPHLPRPAAAQVITEKRATAASHVGRPAIPTAWLRRQRIYLAGDYLHPRYPATLEAAVQSGRQAAALLLKDAGRQEAT